MPRKPKPAAELSSGWRLRRERINQETLAMIDANGGTITARQLATRLDCHFHTATQRLAAIADKLEGQRLRKRDGGRWSDGHHFRRKST